MSIKGFSVGGNVERYDYNSLDNLPSEITIDPALSGSSTNPVQNKVVTGAINATTDSVAALSGEVSDLKSATDRMVHNIITGDVTKDYIYTIDNLITQLPNFTSYSDTSDSFTIGTDKITINKPIRVFTYYINPFSYTVGDHLVGNVKLKVTSKTDATNQLVTISFYNYTSTGADVNYGAYVYIRPDTIDYGTQLNGVRTGIGTALIDEEINIPIDIGTTLANSKNKFITLRTSNATDNTFSLEILEVNVWVDDGRTEKTIVKYSEYAETAGRANYASAVAGKLDEKTWGAIGDSLTATYFDVYVSYIEDNTDVVGTNYGIGGTCIANNANADVTPSFVDRVCGLNGQPGYNDSFDLWTIFGGANDIIKSTPIGTINDSTDTTFYGALNLIVQHLLGLTNHPTVALIAPYYIHGHSSYTDYCDAIEKIANKYGLMFLDLSKVSGINSVNRAVYLRDGVHPTQSGVDKIRPIMLEWFNTIRLPETTTPMPH